MPKIIEVNQDQIEEISIQPNLPDGVCINKAGREAEKVEKVLVEHVLKRIQEEKYVDAHRFSKISGRGRAHACMQ